MSGKAWALAVAGWAIGLGLAELVIYLIPGNNDLLGFALGGLLGIGGWFGGLAYGLHRYDR